MRRAERTNRDRRKALEIVRTQLEIQSKKELKGNDLSSFVRLSHFYLRALGFLQDQPEPEPDPDAWLKRMPPSERRMWKNIKQAEAEQKRPEQSQAQPEGESNESSPSQA